MIDSLTIRPEQEKDIERIGRIIKSAFKDHHHSNRKEHLLISDLRDNDALAISLVAENKQHILGHIAFSEILINGEFQSWYGLAPVSVEPEYQNQGIGSKLIKAGLNKLKELGANGCVLVGEPDYYNRFGFGQNKRLTLINVNSTKGAPMADLTLLKKMLPSLKKEGTFWNITFIIYLELRLIK